MKLASRAGTWKQEQSLAKIIKPLSFKLSITGLCLTDLRYTSSTMHRHKFNSCHKNSIYVCSDWNVEEIWSCGTLYQLLIKTQWGWCDSLFLCVAYNYFNAYMYRLQTCYYLDTLTSCCLKGFSDSVWFIFRVFFPHHVRLAKVGLWAGCATH